MTTSRPDPEHQPLPDRHGARPLIDGPAPHAQRSQNAPPALQGWLFARASALPGVRTGPSGVSVAGARVFHLLDDSPAGPPEAFQGREGREGREFAHLHPTQDGSLHLTLPTDPRDEAFARGWGEPHPISGTPLVYGPRNEDELEVAWLLLQASWTYATGRRR